MKKSFICFMAILPLLACTRQKSENAIPVNWNGYESYRAAARVIHPLLTGKNIFVGTVTYGLDQNANFYTTYDCRTTGWTITETRLFAGDKRNLPLNKHGYPEISQFPNSGYHFPGVGAYTKIIPLEQLPACSSPGFIVASQCIVYSPEGQSVSAWAEGDYSFAGIEGGCYDVYFYDPPPDQYPILYSTFCCQDTLLLYHIDVKSGLTDLIFKEHVGYPSGHCNGAAFDLASGMFFFTKFKSDELFLNLDQGMNPSFCAGKLSGPASCGTFYNDSYYYVNDVIKTLNIVSFSENWMICSEHRLDTIPARAFIKDIAMSPAGDRLYLLGNDGNGESELFSWDLNDKTFYSTSIEIYDDVHISFGSDNLLYALLSPENGGVQSIARVIDTENVQLEVMK